MQRTTLSLDARGDSSFVIEASNVVKQYGSITALAGLDLRVKPGEIYGLLGPNGAGKSTMIKIIAGLIRQSSGEVKVNGLDPWKNPVEVKSMIGYVSENSMLYDTLSPRDFFEFVASIRGVEPEIANAKVATLTKAFGLEEYYDSPIATLSLGTKQKISIIGAFIHEPDLLLLDEPLNGLDARSSRIVKDLISLHSEMRGCAVLFSTHLMEIAEHVCKKIGIIYQGKIVAEGSLDELRAQATVEGNVASEKKSLEEIFLKLTHEEDEVAETIRALRQSFS